jgi:DsbC/DsbD-like thiol-disulfide interchange protein
MKFILNLGVVGFLALFSLALPLHAEKPDVRAKIVAPRSVAAGSRTTLVVEMTLGPNWHVNSHTPAEKYLIPTSVTLSTTNGTLSPVRYPRHVEKRFAFSEEPMAVYEGTVRFETELSLPADATGDVSITGRVSFQACNDRQCFPSAKIPLEASVPVSPAGDHAPER